MIKYWILVCLLGLAAVTKSQNLPRGITFHNCGEVKPQTNPGGIPIYAIQDQNNTAPFGNIVFQPDTTNHWEFNWEFEGIFQPVVYQGDSSQLTIKILGAGRYVFTAKKDTVLVSSGEFMVFYDHVPEFEAELLDTMDCHTINIKIKNFEYDSVNIEGVPYYGSYPLEFGLTGKTLVKLTDVPSYGRIYTERPIDVTYENQTFSMTVVDHFGFTWQSKEVEYTSVIPKAEFRVSPDKGEAPLEAEFSSTSINVQKWEWFLFRDSIGLVNVGNQLIDSLIDNNIRTEETFSYIYEHPGSYKVFLVATNTNGVNHCTDTAAFILISVDASLVDVPNVFTPNGDGVNDIFKAKTRSLESFEGVILNRWGRKVFEWRDPHDGWNGRIGGSYADPGTYYYIITARGREIITKKYTKKGPLMLIR